MAPVDFKVKTHVVDLKKWETDKVSIIFYNDKIYTKCEYKDSFGKDECKNPIFRIGWHVRCKRKIGMCRDHFISTNSCTCSPCDDSNGTGGNQSINIEKQFEQRIQILLPAATLKPDDHLATPLGLSTTPASIPSTSYALESSSEKKKKKKSKKTDIKLLFKTVFILQKELNNLRKTVKSRETDNEDVHKSIQDALNETKSQLLHHGKQQDSIEIQTQVNTIKIKKNDEAVLELGTRKRPHSDSS